MTARLELDTDRIVQLYTEGHPAREIGELMGCSYATIYTRLREAGCHIRTNSEAKLLPVREDAFAEVTDEPTAYWLGFILADGCVAVAAGKGATKYVFSMKLSPKDREHLESLRVFIGSKHKIGYYSYAHQYGPCVGIGIRNDPFCYNLLKWGVVPNKTSNFQYPAIAPELERHLVRGLMDGDGCWCNYSHSSGNPRLMLSLACQPECVHAVRDYIASLGICQSYGSIYTPTMGDERHVQELRYYRNSDVIAIGQHLYNGATVYLPRKKETFDAMLRRWQAHSNLP